MTLSRKNYSYLERERALIAESEAERPFLADDAYHERQRRMDDTARAVMANLWCTFRPTVINEAANETLRQLACESWQIALAMEQTRIGYDCAAMQGKRRDQELADRMTPKENEQMPPWTGVHNVD